MDQEDHAQHVFDQSLYLMFFRDNGKYKFYNPVSEDTYTKDFPMLEDCKSRFCSSNFGWLLMNEYYEDYCSLSIVNLFTSELVIIPPLLHDGFNIFHFSSPPTSSDCTVVAMKNDSSSGTKIGVIKLGEENWTISQFQGKFNTSFCNGVFFDGRYYCMGEDLNIGIFDFKTNDWKVCDKHIVHHHKHYLYRSIGMVEDNGGILVVYESHDHQQLHAARFDLSKMMWEKVDSLGDDKALYVSQGASYLETVGVANDMGNKIYFPKFNGDKGVFYCLATNKYYSRDGKYCSQVPYELEEPCLCTCTWFKPNYSKLEPEEEVNFLTSDGTEIHFSSGPFYKWSALFRSEHPIPEM